MSFIVIAEYAKEPFHSGRELLSFCFYRFPISALGSQEPLRSKRVRPGQPGSCRPGRSRHCLCRSRSGVPGPRRECGWPRGWRCQGPRQPGLHDDPRSHDEHRPEVSRLKPGDGHAGKRVRGCRNPSMKPEARVHRGRLGRGPAAGTTAAQAGSCQLARSHAPENPILAWMACTAGESAVQDRRQGSRTHHADTGDRTNDAPTPWSVTRCATAAVRDWRPRWQIPSCIPAKMAYLRGTTHSHVPMAHRGYATTYRVLFGSTGLFRIGPEREVDMFASRHRHAAR